uniref:Plac8 onzin related protein 6 n=1 Tax=Oryzias latipes TaxID=8090 RepID=A0A3P9KPQ5_ORYLA
MAQNALVEWNTGLCDCFEDAATCCYDFWCGPCLACSVSGKFGEFYCLPLCDYFCQSTLNACGIPCFVPPVAFSTRSSMRNRYGIKGSLCKDLVVSCCCVWCSWCQMHRELKHQKKAPEVIHMQPQTFVNMQPISVMMVSETHLPAVMVAS